jgi:hypothetical protein
MLVFVGHIAVAIGCHALGHITTKIKKVLGDSLTCQPC